MFDPQHLLDVRAAVHARRASRFRDAQIRKLRFPRAQHVRLHLHEIADLSGFEQCALGDFDRGRDLWHETEKYIADGSARLKASRSFSRYSRSCGRENARSYTRMTEALAAA